MSNNFETTLVSLFDTFGGTALLRKTSKTPLVIYWHGIAEKYHEVIESECISSFDFEKEIQYLVKHYEVISMDEYYERYKNHDFTNKEAVITFDDGYKNNLTVAAPILKKYNLPFTVFISAGNVETSDRFYVLDPRLIIVGAELNSVELPCLKKVYNLKDVNDRIRVAYEIEHYIKVSPLGMALQIDKELRENIGESSYRSLCFQYNNMELLSWAEVKDLQSNYRCTIGSHTIDHCCCHSSQSDEVLLEQILGSKKMIEEKTGTKCDYFAYPNGNYTIKSDEIVAAHYKMGFSTQHRSVYSEGERMASVGRVSSAREYRKFKIIISTQANDLLKRK